jgi:hypothetical protein
MTMSETILLGRGSQIMPVPRPMWEEHLAQAPEHSRARLSFMSPEHHQVRYFVVRELVRRSEPLEPKTIATELLLPLERVNGILDELERNLFFLFRNSQGAVSWAYPVTVEPTPHTLRFHTGERLYAA